MNGTYSQKIGEFVRQQRLAIGLSQEEVAAKCKTGQFTISRLENGRPPTLHLLDRIARALGCRLVLSFVPNGKKRR